MAKDVAQRELDQAGFRISNLGAPAAAGDATKTDNTFVPLPSSGTGSPGSSLLAAPADHVHPAAPGTGGGAPAMVSVSAPGYQKVTGTTEEVIYEQYVDLNPLGTPKMNVAFSGIFKVEGSAGADFKVRIGGAVGAADGEVFATISLSATDFKAEDATVLNVANPGRHQLVKITAVGQAADVVAHARGREIQLRAVAA